MNRAPPPCFQYVDYKAYLKALIEFEPRGFISRLAEAITCQRSYLSVVINGEIQVTPDQAYNISQYLRHSEAEQQYFLTMVEVARASTKSYRDHLQGKLERLKREEEDLSKKLKRTPTEHSAKEAFYYSSHLPGLMHILTSIPKYQKIEGITRELGFSRDFVEQLLLQLEGHDLVSRQKDGFVFKGQSLHVAKTSPYVVFHHQNWRQQAVLDAQKNSPEGVHYTNVQSMSRKAHRHIKQKLLELIQEAAEISEPSQEEVLVGFLADLFIIAE
jgi:hypothetical protein